MRYSAKTDEPGGAEITALRESLEALLQGLGLALIELDVFHRKARKGLPAAVQVRVIVYRAGDLGTGDCSRAHYAMLPLLEQAFSGRDLSVEVSTPGINRIVRDGVELAHYKGRGVRCWRTDISDWSAGILEDAGGQGITINGTEGSIRLDYDVIAKVKLDPSQEE